MCCLSCSSGLRPIFQNKQSTGGCLLNWERRREGEPPFGRGSMPSISRPIHSAADERRGGRQHAKLIFNGNGRKLCFLLFHLLDDLDKTNRVLQHVDSGAVPRTLHSRQSTFLGSPYSHLSSSLSFFCLFFFSPGPGNVYTPTHCGSSGRNQTPVKICQLFLKFLSISP